jgi:hypothetical protein
LVLVSGAIGYLIAGRHEQRTSAPVGAASRPMRACPPSSWARGGGTDYAVSGISCRDVNLFVRKGRTWQPGAQEGRALRFGDWICFQRSLGRHGPVLNICANGQSRMRFLMH